MKKNKKNQKKSLLQNKILFIVAGFLLAVWLLSYRAVFVQFFQNELAPLPSTNGLSDTYSGILPCADCSGLETTLIFHKSASSTKSGTYTMKQIYQGKQVNPLMESGIWTIVIKTYSGKDINVYRLTADKTNAITYYMQLDDIHIKLLDNQGNEIVTPFNITLTKQL